jgi:hypothetical protein
MTSDSGCCYWHCFIKDRDDSKPWYERHLCGRTLYSIGGIILIILAFVFCFGLFALFVFGTGYLGSLVLPIVRSFKCLDNYGICGFLGFLYYIFIIMIVISVNFAISPLHLLLYYQTKTWTYSYTVVLPVLTPVYLVGPELLTAIIKGSTCQVDSYYGFMNGLCVAYGCLILLSIGMFWLITWGVIVGVMKLIKCSKKCKKTYHEQVDEKPTDPSSVSVN